MFDTVRKIADFYGFSRVSFYSYLRRGIITTQPPGKYDIRTVGREIVKDWQRIRTGDGDFESANALAQARAELTRVRSESLAFKNLVRRQEYVHTAEARSECRNLMMLARESLLGLPAQAATDCEGRSGAEIKRILALYVQPIVDTLGQPMSWGRQRRGPP